MSSAFCSKSCRCKNKGWCAKDYNPEPDDYECFEPMTNADKYFRNATDEEIAELMTKTESEFNCFPGATNADCEKAGFWWNGCKKCWLDWLKQEVESDG